MLTIDELENSTDPRLFPGLKWTLPKLGKLNADGLGLKYKEIVSKGVHDIKN